MSNSLGVPTTKQFREHLKHCFKQHGVVVKESRTRPITNFLAWRHFSVGSYTYGRQGPGRIYRRMIFKIHCKSDQDKAAINAAVNDAKVIMALSGQDARIKLLFRKWEPLAELEAVAIIA